jgi:ABC-2 type transport system ATP-binding protein
MSEPALRFDHVTRRFGPTLALDRLDLSVEPGTVLGLVGRNGAGKTTSLRLAIGLLHADHGRIRVLGLDPARQPIEVCTRVSLLAEESSLYPWMTVREILDFGAALHPRWDTALASSLSERLQLDDRPLVRALARGTRAKVALVLAVACRPDLLLLDDPTAGLDPLVRREVLEGLLASVPDEGGAVVYASHLIHDVERVADRVAFLDEGRLLLEGPLQQLKEEVHRVTAVFGDDPPAAVMLPGQIDLARDGRTLSAVARCAPSELEARARELGADRVEVETLALEEIVIACLKGKATDEVEHV